jgi:hypothetical protein
MRAPRITVLAGTVVVALAAASIAAAQFTASLGGGSMNLSSSTLAAPTGVTPTQTNCRNNKPVEITVTWTATASAYATGYTVERATTSGGPFSTIGTVAIGTTTYVDTAPVLAYTTSYYYRVQSTYLSWTAASTQGAVTTLSIHCV